MASRVRCVWNCAVLGLLLWSLTGCAQPHPQTSPASDLRARQMHKLAEMILENTPEHTHFAWPAFFKWVVLSTEIEKNPADLNREVLDLLKRKYKVYVRGEDLPDHLLHKDNKGQLTGYEGGFSFKFVAEFEDDVTVKVKYGDWEGNLAGSWHWKRYKWDGARWKVIEKSGMLVS
jgi:hypothetical protein